MFLSEISIFLFVEKQQQKWYKQSSTFYKCISKTSFSTKKNHDNLLVFIIGLYYYWSLLLLVFINHLIKIHIKLTYLKNCNTEAT
jgi:hypothetical protein